MAHADTQQHTQQMCGVMLSGIATRCAVSRHQLREIAGPTEEVGAGGMGAHLKWLSLSTKVPLWLVRRLSTCPIGARTLLSQGQHLLMTAFRCTRRSSRGKSPCTFRILVGKKVPASAAWSGRMLCEAMYTLTFIPSLPCRLQLFPAVLNDACTHGQKSAVEMLRATPKEYARLTPVLSGVDIRRAPAFERPRPRALCTSI